MSRLLLALACALGLAHAPPSLATLNVVATMPDLASLARTVGGEDARVTALARSGEDPHFVDPRPSHVLTLSRADLLVQSGLGLEVGWLPSLLTASRNRHIQPGARGYLDASSVVELLDVPTGRVDRRMGDVHPGGNPHFALSPRAMARVALALGDRMAQLDPPHADGYGARAQALATELRALAETEAARFARLPQAQRRVVVYHESLLYLSHWLGLDKVATLEPRPGIQPTPAHLAHVASTMKTAGVRVILQEEFYPRAMSQKLASMVGGEVVVLPGGTRVDDGQSYAERARLSAGRVYDALAR